MTKYMVPTPTKIFSENIYDMNKFAADFNSTLKTHNFSEWETTEHEIHNFYMPTPATYVDPDRASSYPTVLPEFEELLNKCGYYLCSSTVTQQPDGHNTVDIRWSSRANTKYDAISCHSLMPATELAKYETDDDCGFTQVMTGLMYGTMVPSSFNNTNGYNWYNYTNKEIIIRLSELPKEYVTKKENTDILHLYPRYERIIKNSGWHIVYGSEVVKNEALIATTLPHISYRLMCKSRELDDNEMCLRISSKRRVN